jgi:putative ABC transport system permease protein
MPMRTTSWPLRQRSRRVVCLILWSTETSRCNALFTTWATVLDARRSSALMRALGARTGQVSSGLVIAQLLSALPGALLGIPLGYGLFKAAVHGGTLPPPTWLAAAVLGVLVAMAGLTIVPATIGARQPVAEVLQSEVA